MFIVLSSAHHEPPLGHSRLLHSNHPHSDVFITGAGYPTSIFFFLFLRSEGKQEHGIYIKVKRCRGG